jgi:hypothetical protein
LKFKYELPERFVTQTKELEEFANGGMQVSMKLKDGRVMHQILLSNATWIVAMRGQKDLPFQIDDIEQVFQLDGDQNPVLRDSWEFWDQWR